MTLSTLDWGIIILFFALTLLLGLLFPEKQVLVALNFSYRVGICLGGF